jgi:hypothetical protein
MGGIFRKDHSISKTINTVAVMKEKHDAVVLTDG